MTVDLATGGCAFLGALVILLGLRVWWHELREKDLRHELAVAHGRAHGLRTALEAERREREKLVSFANREVGRVAHLTERVKEQELLIDSLVEQIDEARGQIADLADMLDEAERELSATGFGGSTNGTVEG